MVCVIAFFLFAPVLLCYLCASLLNKLSRLEDGCGVLLRLHAHATLGVWHHLTPGLCDISAHILSLVLALLDKHGVTLLSIHLLPHHGLVGGHVHTELLVMQVNIGTGVCSSCVTIIRVSSANQVTGSTGKWIWSRIFLRFNTKNYGTKSYLE